jgi:enoyl-CoA hydratase/carnithine racemase
MALVEIERDAGIMVIRLNRPERMNALSMEMRELLAEAWCEFRDSRELEVAIVTGTGRAFCAGEDMKESVERGTIGRQATRVENPYMAGKLDKPVIAAVNGVAMGGGFMMAEQADLRIAARGAVFESSEAKRWLLGGYNHGVKNNLPHAIATEMAFAFRFTAERLYEAGFLNRLVEPDELLPTARTMARHLLGLPPASRVNTTVMMRAMRPAVGAELERLAARLHEHGAKSDRIESRRAFAEKRAPEFKGWDHPGDRERTPKLGDGQN